MRLFSSLRIRLLMLVLLAVLPALVLALYTAAEQRRLATSTVQADALRLVRLASADQERLIEGAHQLLVALAQLPQVRGGDSVACSALFADLLKQYPLYANLGAIEPDGDLFCSGLPQSGPINLADRVYFRRALETRGFAVGEYQIGRVTGKATINFGNPVLDESGRPQAVVFAALDLDWLGQLAAQGQLDDGWTLTVLDRNGTVLARYPDPEKWVGQSFPEAPVLESILRQQGKGTAEVSGLDGLPQLHAFAPLGGAATARDVYVSIAVPKAVAFAEVDRMLRLNLAWLGLATVLGLLAAWAVGSLSIVRQVGTLLRVSRRLAAGDLNARSELPPAPGELGQLGRAVDEIADALRTRHAEAKQAEALRRVAETRLAAIVEIAADAIIAIDEEQRIILFNRGAEQIFGYRADEVLGQPHDILLPERFIAAHSQHIRDFAARPDVARFMGQFAEVVARRKDGTEFPAEISIAKLTEEEQTTFTVILRDITERKQTEEALRRQAGRLETMHEIDQGVLAARPARDIAEAALSRIRRLVPCEGVGVLVPDFHNRQAHVWVADAEEEFGLREGDTLRLEDLYEINSLRRGQDIQIPDIAAVEPRAPVLERVLAYGIRSVITVPLIAENDFVGALGLAATRPGAFGPEQMEIVREIGHQLAVALRQARLRAALASEQRRLETLVEHLPEGVLLLDANQRILLANPAARSYLPLLTKVTVGGVLTDLGGRPLAELATDSARGWYELTLGRAEPRVFEVAVRSLVGEQGPAGSILVLRDVTRERDIQGQLQRQERLAAVGQVTAGIVHDFRNFLTTIIGYAELLKLRSRLRGDARENLELIIQQGYRAADLASRILDFSRQSTPERRPLDLSPFAQEMVKLLRGMFPEDIELALDHDAGEYWVSADQGQLQEAVMNMTFNARDAMPNGGRLTIRLSRLTLGVGTYPPYAGMAPGEWIRLELSDTGIGIPPDILPRIFEPFFTTKDRAKGTGLGLAQVRGLVRQHDGHIDVKSTVGQGTTFITYLPALAKKVPTA